VDLRAARLPHARFSLPGPPLLLSNLWGLWSLRRRSLLERVQRVSVIYAAGLLGTPIGDYDALDAARLKLLSR
jgi:hypothetical protein